MKLLVIGSTGMLGSDILKVKDHSFQICEANSKSFDITDLNSTLNYIKELKPDSIINSAAYTNVDDCETNIDKAFKVNALGSRNIAIAAQEIKAELVYVSTDYVYDGTKTSSYFEYDKVNPLSIYGKSKLEGENFVREITDKHYIVRTSWLFGQNGRNFVKTMLELSETRNELKVVNDQVGSPTYTPDLANAIIDLIGSKCYGTFHITNNEHCSWHDFAKIIYELANIRHVELTPIQTEELNRPAPRPKNSVLEKFYLKLNGFNELRSYKEALCEYIKLVNRGGV